MLRRTRYANCKSALLLLSIILCVSLAFSSIGHGQRPPVKGPDRSSTLFVTNELVVEGVIQKPDGTPAEAGLQVTITVGDHSPEAVSSTSGGSYALIFRGPIVAKLGDTVKVRVSRETGGPVARTVKLERKDIRDKRVIIDVRFPKRRLLPSYLLFWQSCTCFCFISAQRKTCITPYLRRCLERFFSLACNLNFLWSPTFDRRFF